MSVQKYICTVDEGGKEQIFIFPRDVMHDCMAESLGGIKNNTGRGWRRVMRSPVSAGFVDMETGACFGESESLGLPSRPQDAEILKNQN